VGDIVTFRDGRLERRWVPKADEERWVRFWQAGGIPAARWLDYKAWGGFWPRLPADDVIRGKVTLRKPTRKRTNYARWKGY
jgi:hypothetical protein